MPRVAEQLTRRTGPSLLVPAALAIAAMALAAPSAEGLELRRVARFTQPVYATAPPGDKRRLYVAERAGRVFVVRHGGGRKRAFLRIRGLVDLRFPNNQFRDQGGVLSMAFAPDYRRSGLFYLLYTHRDGSIHLDEFSRSRRSPRRASPASRRTVLTIPRSGRTDLGGHLEFGPDGLLYISLGFGGIAERSQDLSVLAGKLLRIDPRPTAGLPYGVPAANPFAGVPGARPEILALGLRNPWRFSFDPRGNALVLPDVGDERFEEINLLPASGSGWNLGWPAFEGDSRHGPGSAAGLTFPVLSLRHSPSLCAIVGGYVVRRGLGRLRGRYLFGDVCSGRLRSVRLRSPRAGGARSERLAVPYLASFGRDGRGRIYAVSLLGAVYRLTR